MVKDIKINFISLILILFFILTIEKIHSHEEKEDILSALKQKTTLETPFIIEREKSQIKLNNTAFKPLLESYHDKKTKFEFQQYNSLPNNFDRYSKTTKNI